MLQQFLLATIMLLYYFHGHSSFTGHTFKTGNYN